MSRFSPKVPEPKKDSGAWAAASKSDAGFKRTGASVNAAASGAPNLDPGRHVAASSSGEGFRRTGSGVSGSGSSGKSFQGVPSSNESDKIKSKAIADEEGGGSSEAPAEAPAEVPASED